MHQQKDILHDKLIITDNNTLTLEMSGTDEIIDINDVGNHATDTLLINEWVHIAITREEDNELAQIQVTALSAELQQFVTEYQWYQGQQAKLQQDYDKGLAALKGGQ